MVAVAALGALTAFALPHAGNAANPKLFGTITAGGVITLTDSDGHTVTSIQAGTYDIEVTDDSAIHNFDLQRPDSTSADATDIVGMGTVTWTDVSLTPGTWTYLCDAHPYIQGTFTVTGGSTTSTAATTSPASTAPPTTAPTEPTTTAPTTTSGPAKPCIVPKLAGTTLPVARRRLARTSCRLGRIGRVYSRKVRRGRVISQRPDAGRRVGYGTAVNVVLSRGRRR
jgi:plastocyanin